MASADRHSEETKSTSGAENTIYALASGAGHAGIAVVRLSGGACAGIFEELTNQGMPIARMAVLRQLTDPATGDAIDQAMIIWFPGPASFTGEDVLEFHVHGSPAVLGHLFDVLRMRPDTRMAEPGEFSRRAFLNGKLDLTEAEGLADLVAAETREQARQARRQKDGALGRLYERWREALVGVLAHLEAEIDFAPDEEVPEGLAENAASILDQVRSEVKAHLEDERGERLRHGLHVAVVGPPNAGKSTLINTLARRDIAITTDTPGTTRDILEVALDIEGYPLTLVDMAGLRETDDPIERIGVERARRRAREAEGIIALFDGAGWPDLDPETCSLIDEHSIVAINKVDLLEGPAEIGMKEHHAIGISCRTGEGLECLVLALAEMARRTMSVGEAPLLTRVRHREALGDVLSALIRMRASENDLDLGLMAENLRHAVHSIGRVTGRVGVEDLLDQIFGEFCIGK